MIKRKRERERICMRHLAKWQKRSKCSNDPYSQYRTSSQSSPLHYHHHKHFHSHLHYTINHHKHFHSHLHYIITHHKRLSCFMQLHNRIQDVHLELLQRHINFHPDHLKSVGENEAKMFCFALTLCPPCKVKFNDSCIKWQKSVVL